MTLRERWKAKESRIGEFLKKELAVFLSLCAAVGGLFEYFQLIPADVVPQWVKVVVFIAGCISFVAGKLTVKK